MKNYFVGCEVYDTDKIQQFLKNSDVNGLILGDLFCQKRMFQNGIVDLVLHLNQILLSEKEVVYQAPLYVTGRNLDEVKGILHLMDGYKKNSYVIVQDFGTAQAVARDYKNIQLIWGRLGRVREKRYSDDFLIFLKEKGFAGMETGDQMLAERIHSFGLIPFFNNRVLQYQTLGRNCYLEYETGHCEPGLCRNGCYSLKAENEEFEMTIDGYILGKKYLAVPEEVLQTVCNKYDARLILRER